MGCYCKTCGNLVEEDDGRGCCTSPLVPGYRTIVTPTGSGALEVSLRPAWDLESDAMPTGAEGAD